VGLAAPVVEFSLRLSQRHEENLQSLKVTNSLSGRLLMRGAVSSMRLLVAVLSAASSFASISSSRAQPSVEHGRYLVDAILGCADCHSPKGPDKKPIPGREFSGGNKTYNAEAYSVTASNLTSDKETGLGDWTANDLKLLFREGIRPDGVPVAPIMPVNFYKAITDEDIESIASYLKTLSAIKNSVPTPSYLKETKFDVVPDAALVYSAKQMAMDPVSRGRYLATLGHCLLCHTPSVDGVTDYERNAGRGGKRMGGILVPNITSSKTAGIGDWSDEDIRRALTKGIGRDGHELQDPPMPWAIFANLTSSDVSSLVAWLRTLPPKE
jgi:mono/diheme cytochrome c family protein